MFCYIFFHAQSAVACTGSGSPLQHANAGGLADRCTSIKLPAGADERRPTGFYNVSPSLIANFSTKTGLAGKANCTFRLLKLAV